MVKKRVLQPATDNAKAIDQFVSQADSVGGGIEQPLQRQLDPNAPRTFKGIRVPFNECEHSQLEEAVKISGRSKLNHIRFALQKYHAGLKKEQDNN
jgi:hypothetical protein